MSTSAETSCVTCAHNEVCKFKEEFIKAKLTVDDVLVHLDNGRCIRLRDMTFVSNVVLLCQHYSHKQGGTIR